MSTDMFDIRSLVGEINSAAKVFLLESKSSADGMGRSSSLAALVTAAEKLIIAARWPEENLYAMATNVWIFPIFSDSQVGNFQI